MTDELYDPGVPAISSFKGRWHFLSNFSTSLLVIEGVVYDSGEHGFHALKTLDPAQREWIRQAATPKEAKYRGRQVTLRDGWDAGVDVVCMRQVQRQKYQGDRRVKALLSTGRAQLIEGNRWHDNKWGDCHCGRLACLDLGANYLGRILMELRAELANLQHLTAIEG